MSATGDKIKGTANDLIGEGKQAVGKATGNDKLRAEGAAQEAKGEVQKKVGDVKDTAGDVKDAVKKP
ncbi:CsbD family protein [Pseudomonas sp.]|uniref:CsbD family protein n=1 Tax=Pseudomonas sp. TaxID=306 RepID=UPI0028A6DCCD|nr:CsbD family protein [Pseudomonas sp.]